MTTIDDTTLLAYVDGELDSATARTVEAAVRDDPVAQRKVRLLRESATLVRAAINEPIHGPTPHRLIAALLGSAPERVRDWPRRRWLVGAGAAMMIFAGFAAGFFTGRVESPSDARLAADEDLVDEIVAYHSFYAELPPGALTVRSDRTLMEAWLSRHLQRPVLIPDLSAKGLDFSTARLFDVDDKPVAQIVYDSPGSPPIALCVAVVVESKTLPFAALRRKGFTLISWQRAGYLYFVVGAAPEGRLREISTEISTALQPA